MLLEVDRESGDCAVRVEGKVRDKKASGVRIAPSTIAGYVNARSRG